MVFIKVAFSLHFLLAVYPDGLIEELSNSGVGCYWGLLFAGAVVYADDVVLLAPCASALRCMLNICNTFALQHGLIFNAKKSSSYVLEMLNLKRTFLLSVLEILY